jgi:hypothetical protein
MPKVSRFLLLLFEKKARSSKLRVFGSESLKTPFLRTRTRKWNWLLGW